MRRCWSWFGARCSMETGEEGWGWIIGWRGAVVGKGIFNGRGKLKRRGVVDGEVAIFMERGGDRQVQPLVCWLKVFKLKARIK